MKKFFPLFAVIIVLVLAVCSFHIIPTGYTGVKTSFGQIQETTIQSGKLNFCIPFVQSIHKVNNKQQDKHIEAQVWGEASDKTPVYAADVIVTYQVLPEKSAWLYANVSDIKNLVGDELVASAIKSAMAELGPNEVTNRTKIEPLAQQKLAEQEAAHRKEQEALQREKQEFEQTKKLYEGQQQELLMKSRLELEQLRNERMEAEDLKREYEYKIGQQECGIPPSLPDLSAYVPKPEYEAVKQERDTLFQEKTQLREENQHLAIQLEQKELLLKQLGEERTSLLKKLLESKQEPPQEPEKRETCCRRWKPNRIQRKSSRKRWMQPKRMNGDSDLCGFP